MTWICRYCKMRNIFWRSACEKCGMRERPGC